MFNVSFCFLTIEAIISIAALATPWENQFQCIFMLTWKYFLLIYIALIVELVN